MLNFEIDNSALSRRVVQAVCDLAHRPLAGLRVLDLACAHGHYAFEMAKLGANDRTLAVGHRGAVAVSGADLSRALRRESAGAKGGP